MANSALLPNFILMFLVLYFGLVIEGEEKFSFRQWIYIILIVIDITLLGYINREIIIGFIFPRLRKVETGTREEKQDEVKDFIE